MFGKIPFKNRIFRLSVVLIALLALYFCLPRIDRLADRLVSGPAPKPRPKMTLTAKQIERLKKFKIARLSFDNQDHIVLPKGFPEDYDAVLPFHDSILPGGGKDVPSYTISWRDRGTDGSLYITFLPNFAYLHTGHENPNPNRLEWYTLITYAQFKAVRIFFQEHQSNSGQFFRYPGAEEPDSLDYKPFFDYISISYGDKATEWDMQLAWHIESKNRDQYTRLNLQYIFDAINRFIAKGAPRLKAPGRLELAKFHSLLMPFGLYELADMGYTPGSSRDDVEKHTVNWVGWQQSLSKPITLVVENKDVVPARLDIDLEKLNLQGKPISSLKVVSGESLEPGKDRQVPWNPTSAPKGFIQPGATMARFKVFFGLPGAPGSSVKTTSYFSLDYAEDASGIFSLGEYRYVLEELYYFTREKQYRNDPKAFSKAEKALADLWAYMSYGFEYRFYCDYGERFNGILSALKAVGAHKNAKVFEEMMTIFPADKVPRNQKECDKFSTDLPQSAEDKLFDLKNELYKSNEDLQLLLHQYVITHKSEFMD